MYNNYFPVTYPQTPPISYPQYQQTAANQQQGIIWVQGEAGAKSYLVAPNSTVQLWDSEAQVIYLKSADASGMPSMKIIDDTIRDNQNQPIPTAGQTAFVSKDEFDNLQKQVNSVVAKLNALAKELDYEPTV